MATNLSSGETFRKGKRVFVSLPLCRLLPRFGLLKQLGMSRTTETSLGDKLRDACPIEKACWQSNRSYVMHGVMQNALHQ